MTAQKPKVLFLSTGNATRSLIAEGFLRALTGGQFDIASAGAKPSDLSPLASEVMKEAGIDISGQKPQRIAQSLKERFGYVITIVTRTRNAVRYSLLPSIFDIGALWTQISPMDCPNREESFFAKYATRFWTKLNNSLPIPHN